MPFGCISCGCEELFTNSREGVVECKGCGTVNESGLLDTRTEWRDFGDRDKDTGHDPSRVGRAVDMTRLDGGLGTYADAGRGRGLRAMAQSLNRTKAGGAATHDRRMRATEGRVRVWAQEIGAAQRVIDTAVTLTADLLRKHSEKLRGKSAQAVDAAVLYHACHMEGHHVNFKQIQALANIDRKPFHGAYRDVDRALKELSRSDKAWNRLYFGKEVDSSVTKELRLQLQNLVREISLNESQREVLAAFQRAAEEAAAIAAADADGAAGRHWPWDARQPPTVAGALLLLMSALPGALLPLTLLQVKKLTGQAESTLSTCYSELRSHARELVPRRWASDEALARLPMEASQLRGAPPRALRGGGS